MKTRKNKWAIECAYCDEENCVTKLQRKSFGQLREIIDCCLEGRTLGTEDESLATTDKFSLFEAGSFLESKIGERLGDDDIAFRRQVFHRIVWDIDAHPAKTPSQLTYQSYTGLHAKRFGELRELIDYCLRGRTKVRQEDNWLVTADKATLWEYARILKAKIRDPGASGKKKKRPDIDFRRKIVARILEDTKALDNFTNRIASQRLAWKLLPPGTGSFPHIVKHFENLSKHRTDIVYDITRLHKAYSLGPDVVYVGIDEFEGYVVFYFRRAETAVLDCPMTGNAIYVFGENWKTLSHLTKFHLLNSRRYDFERIIHTGGWFSRLKSILFTRERRADLRRQQSSNVV